MEVVSEEDPDTSQGEIIAHAGWYHNQRDWRAVLRAVEAKLREQGVIA